MTNCPVVECRGLRSLIRIPRRCFLDVVLAVVLISVPCHTHSCYTPNPFHSDVCFALRRNKHRTLLLSKACFLLCISYYTIRWHCLCTAGLRMFDNVYNGPRYMAVIPGTFKVHSDSSKFFLITWCVFVFF